MASAVSNSVFQSLLRLCGISGGLVGLAWLLESSQWVRPPSTVITVLEAGMGLFAFFRAWRTPIPGARFFALTVLVLAGADTLFFLFNYVHARNIGNEAEALPALALYGVAFLLAAIALFRTGKFRWRGDAAKFVMPAITVLTVILVHFLPYFVSARAQDSGHLLAVVQAGVLGCAAFAGIVSLTVVIQSSSPFLSGFALCFTALPLLFVSMGSEVFLRGPLPFGFYEYFWAFGSFLAEGAILFYIAQLSEARVGGATISGRWSLGVQYRTAIISAVTAALVGASFFSLNFSMRFLTLGVIGSILFAVLVSSFTVDAILRHSASLGVQLQKGFSSSGRGTAQLTDGLPVELESLFSTIFAQALEQEQDRQMFSQRFQEVYRKFAHDLKSPLLAMRNLLQLGDLSRPEVRAVCYESVQAMSLAADHILERLAPVADRRTERRQSSTPAFHLGRSLERCVAIFQAAMGDRADLSIQCSFQDWAGSVWMEQSTFERLLMNVLQNAADYSETRTIRITAQRIADSPDVVIQVRDDGPGASTETLECLNRGMALTTKASGHGIGLSAHRETLASFGGGIAFSRSALGGFQVDVTLRAASEQIVLIDDDRAIQLAWRAMAQSRRVQLECVSPTEDFASRVELWKKGGVEVYVDYHLGERSGVEVLRTLKEAGLTELFLVTSADVSPSLASEWQTRDKSFPRA